LGLNLALQTAQEHTVIGVDKFNLLQPDSFEMLQADLLEEGAVTKVLDQAQPDWLIHCAALANVDACEDDPEFAQRLNAELPGEIAAEAAQRGVRMVHISTDAVFDGKTGNYSEEDTPSPLSVYARTKAESERLAAEANPEAVIARVNFYGWSYSGDRSLAEFFFYNLQKDNPIQGFTDVNYSPLFVKDLGDILMKLLDQGHSGLFNVVSSEQLSKYDFGVALAKKFGFDPGLIEPVSVSESGLKAARSPNLTLNTGKLTQALGSPPPGINAGLERFYQQYQDGYPERLKQLVAVNG
jgi:dTDP-4-dehydrorhamnose reductase